MLDLNSTAESEVFELMLAKIESLEDLHSNEERVRIVTKHTMMADFLRGIPAPEEKVFVKPDDSIAD